MFCINCGREIGDSKYCPYCGHAQENAAPVTPDIQDSYAQDQPYGSTTYRFRGDGVAEIFRGVFRDPLFLIICILMTASAALSFVRTDYETGKITFSVGILEILYVIALWLIFAAARNENHFSGTGLAIASGVVKATYIIVWIIAVIILVVGVLIAVFGPMVIDGIDFDFMNSAGAVRTSLISPNPGSSGGSGSIPLPEGFEWLEGLEGLDNLPYITTIGVRVIGVVLIVLGVLLILVNIFYTRNLHKFTKSLCTSLKSDTYDIRKAKTSHAWMIVSAVFTILAFAGSAALAKDVFDVMSVAKELCSIITIILAAVMIKKHFIND